MMELTNRLLDTMNKHGVKDDAGKPMVADTVVAIADLLEFCPRALAAMGAVADAGGKKYVPGGWLTVPNAFKRYTNAMMRHFLKEARGQKLDEEGLLHAAQVAVNAVYRLELFLRNEEK